MEMKSMTFEQKGLMLYLGVLSTGEVLSRHKVDIWSPSNTDGYQRPLMPRRVSDASWYLKDAEGTFPTSILLSIRSPIEFKSELNLNGAAYGTLQIPDDQPLWVIDGQHRLAGLQKAIDDGMKELADYPLPVVLFVNPDRVDEIRHFYIVNTRAKSVPGDIADRILQKTLKEKGKLWMLTSESSLDKKAQKAVFQGRATDIVDYLRENCDVWADMIVFPGEVKPSRHAIRQHTVVVSLLEGAFKNPAIEQLGDGDIGTLLDRYWCALKEVFPDAFKEPGDHSIQKTPGLYSLHMVFSDIFERCREVRDYSQKNMTEILKQTGLDSAFWHKNKDVGSPLTFGTGMKSLRFLAEHIREQLPKLTLAGM